MPAAISRSVVSMARMSGGAVRLRFLRIQPRSTAGGTGRAGWGQRETTLRMLHAQQLLLR